MKILVLNGSPKGEYSITLQTVEYIKALFPEHEYTILHVGKKIKAFEKDMTDALYALEKAELIIFSYPVYTFIAPYQLHRFIELIKESGVSLEGKYATQITTSKHFYDVTAHRYIEDNCADMGLKYIRGLSADMDDLTTVKGQREAEEFFRFVIYSVQNGICEKPSAVCSPALHSEVTVPDASDGKPGDVVIVTNCTDGDLQLGAMIERFRAIFPRATRVVNIADYPFSGGCLGCFGCAVEGKCVYKDGFDEFLRGNIQKGEAIVYAFSIKDHSMGASFKLYDDRQFCNGHRTVTMGMPMGYIVSGNYSEEYNLQTVIEGRAQVGGNYLAGVATDEYDPDGEIDKLASKLCYAIENSYVPPTNFLGVGGMKIFRDLIYLMQGMMKADHRFYKKHGQYDFPQKKRGTLIKMYLVGALISSPKIKAKMGSSMNEGMLMPYRKVLDKVKKNGK